MGLYFRESAENVVACAMMIWFIFVDSKQPRHPRKLESLEIYNQYRRLSMGRMHKGKEMSGEISTLNTSTARMINTLAYDKELVKHINMDIKTAD